MSYVMNARPARWRCTGGRANAGALGGVKVVIATDDLNNARAAVGY
jgi:hypothetical protein